MYKKAGMRLRIAKARSAVNIIRVDAVVEVLGSPLVAEYDWLPAVSTTISVSAPLGWTR